MTSSTSSSERLVSPPPPYGRTGALATVLAALLPSLIVGAALGWLGRPEEETGAPSLELANCVSIMEKVRPDIVVVGNSKAGTDIDRAALSAALGGRGVAHVGMPATGGHVWYAMLERCVFEKAKPKLVVVYGTLGATLRSTVQGDHDRNGLLAYEGASLPAIQRKVLGATSGPFWGRVERRQGAIRTGLQHVVRDGVAGLFFAPPGGDRLEAGRAWAEPALAKVLGADATADTDRSRAIPIVDAAEKGAVAADTTVEQSLVPDMIEAAREHGARFLLVHAPVADRKPNYETIPAPLARELIQRLNAEGAGFLDLTTERYPGSDFGDGVHMNAGGRVKLTRALGEGLLALDALGTGAFQSAALPRTAPVASRLGTVPALPTIAPEHREGDCGWRAALPGLARVSDSVLNQAGIGPVSPVLVLEDGSPLLRYASRAEFADTCKGAATHQGGELKFSPKGGPADVVATRTYTAVLDPEVPQRDKLGRDVWWVYPGTTVRLDVADAWNEPGTFRVGVSARVAVPGKRTAEIAVAGAPPVKLTALGDEATATVDVPAPSGAWTIEIVSPPDGPWLLLQRVVAGDPAHPWYAVGAPDPARTLALLKGEASWSNVGTLPTMTLTQFKPGGGKMWIAPEVASLHVPSGEDAFSVAGIPGCSFLRVAEDGTPLPGPNTPVAKVKDQGGGKYVQMQFGIGLSTPDGSSPKDNGRTYTLSFEPTRACANARWLYPGDRASFTVGTDLVGKTLRDGATALELTATVFPPSDGAVPEGLALAARLLVDDVVVLDEAVPLTTFAGGQPRWTIPPVPRTARRVVLELTTPPEAPYVLVTDASLVEPSRPAFPSVAEVTTNALPPDVVRGASAP